MTTMVTEIYDALREAGASEEKARRAAEALANYSDRFGEVESRIDRVQTALELRIEEVANKLERRIEAMNADLERQIAALGANLELRIATLRADVERQIAGLRTDFERRIGSLEASVAVLRWMMGTTLTLVVAILIKLFVQ